MTSGRHILITGTSRGLGRAFAEHYLAMGDHVYGCTRGTDGPAHPCYTHLQADLGQAGGPEDLMRRLADEAPRLDVLINSAGIARMNHLALTPTKSIEQMMQTNVVAPFALMREAVRLLRSSDAGRIVNVSTVAVPLRLDGEAGYAASKSALEMLTRIAARELGPMGITCNAVGPSPIRTRLIEGVGEKRLEALIARQAIRRWAQHDDVINVIDFFLHPVSAMVTGQVIYLGGFG